MTFDIEKIKSGNFEEPIVIFPLKQYKKLVDYIEEIEDRLAINERKNEPEISKNDFDKMFEVKFGKL